MTNPMEQLKEFFKLAEERVLSGSDQLAYLHLFNLFNQSNWVDTIRISDKDLLEKLRLYDSTGKPAGIQTLRNVKSRLKLKGFIDFKPGKGVKITEYRLIPLVTETTDSFNDDDRRYSVNSEEVKRAWFNCEGEYLKGGAALGLIELENEYGTQKVVEGIIAASQANKEPRLSFNFVKAIIERKFKGGDLSGRYGYESNKHDKSSRAYRSNTEKYSNLVETGLPAGYDS